jgi:DNA-binding NtrC family response regulator
VIEESDLPYDLALEASAEPQEKSEGQSLDAAILAFEKSFLRKALKKNQWNKKATAAQLGMGYSTLKSKLKSYGIGAGGDGDED